MDPPSAVRSAGEDSHPRRWNGLVDTGADTATGGRLKRVLPYVGDEDFCLTYGNGLADADGRAYEVPEWARSGVYRQRNQENALDDVDG